MIQTIAAVALPQAVLPLRLLGAARGAASWLSAHPMTAIAVLAAILGGIEHHQADKWQAVARQRATTIAQIQSANARAIQQAIAAKEAKDADNAKLAAASDQTAAGLRDRYHVAVLQLAAAQNHARAADLSGDADTAAGGQRTGESAGIPVGPAGGQPDDILTISRDDGLTCADNTARLQAVRDWAVALGH